MSWEEVDIIYPSSALGGVLYEVKILYSMGRHLFLETYRFSQFLDGSGRLMLVLGLVKISGGFVLLVHGKYWCRGKVHEKYWYRKAAG